MKITKILSGLLVSVIFLSASSAFPAINVKKMAQSSIAALKGENLYKAGNYVEATVPLEEAVRARPENSKANYYLALTYEKLGKKDKAMEILKAYLVAAENQAKPLPMDKPFAIKCKALLKELTK